jgi:signal transduction histidine kinase
VQKDNDILSEERDLRDRFVSAITHDLRSPLASVKLGIDLIRRFPDRLDLRETQFLKIDQSLSRINQMIEDLLDANRIQAGHLVDLRIEHFDIAQMVREIAEEFAIIYNREIAFSGIEHLSGFWDPHGVRRIFENLITNAIKYGSPSTQISISLAQAPDSVAISVHNEGNPISESDQAVLFSRYIRSSSAAQGQQRGWGIGLTLVRGFVQAHGGSVTIHSSAQDGTTFTVTLPVDARRQAAK